MEGQCESMPIIPAKNTKISKILNSLDIKHNKEKPLVFLVCTLQILYLCFGV